MTVMFKESGLDSKIQNKSTRAT
jgi:hypothetical protein